jgi:enoyl-CoA hydratase
VGLLPGYGGLLRLRETIGVSHAQRVLALADVTSAKEAQRIGLVHDVVRNADVLLEKALEQAEAVAKVPYQIVALQKLMLIGAQDPARKAALEQEKELFLSLWRNPFHDQFLNGFASKS